MIERKKQLEMELPYQYKVREMGTLESPHKIRLFGLFIRDKLKGNPLDANPVFQEERKKVVCPFCENGFLKIKTVEPIYSDACGLGPEPKTKEHSHSGNSYEYICSNPGCDATFHGRYEWPRMRID